MSNVNEVDWVMELRLQQAFDDLWDHILGGRVTFEEAYNRLKWGYSFDIADWFQEWWDEVSM